jgi:hypothetical protein
VHNFSRLPQGKMPAMCSVRTHCSKLAYVLCPDTLLCALSGHTAPSSPLSKLAVATKTALPGLWCLKALALL